MQFVISCELVLEINIINKSDYNAVISVDSKHIYAIKIKLNKADKYIK